MEEKRRNRLILAFILASISFPGNAWCGDTPEITDDRVKYFLTSGWEMSELGPFTAFDIFDDNNDWKPVTSPFKRDANSLHQYGGFLLRTHFTVSEAMRDRFIGLFTGTMMYSCVFYVNGVCIGTIGGPLPDDFPGGLWDTYADFFIPPDAIRYGGDNHLVVRMRENYPTVKFTSMFISGTENTKKGFFLDHFKFKITQTLAGFISLFIFFPLLYFFVKNRNEIYYLYMFVASLLYGCFGIFASFNIPIIPFPLLYGISRICLAMSLTLIVLTVHSYYSAGKKKYRLWNLVILVNLAAACVYFFLPTNHVKREYQTVHLLVFYMPQIAYAIFIIFYNQIRKVNRDSLLFGGMIVLLAGVLYDVLATSLDFRPVMWFTPIGVITFSLALFVTVAKKYIADVKFTAHNATKLHYAEALFGEKERLDITLNSIGDAVICTNTNGIITLFNKAAEALTGSTKKAMLSKPLAEALCLEKDQADGGSTADRITDLFDMQAPFPLLPVPYVLKRCDGKSHSVLLTKTDIKDRFDRAIGLVWVFHDITERERIERIHRRNQMLESLGLLASGIAHDFNNIFMGILLNVGLAKRIGCSCNGEICELLSGVEHSVTKASILTNQLLTFATGGIPIVQYRDVRPLVMASASYAADGSGVTVAYDFPQDLWNAEVDAGQMSHVIYNLVLNSIQALPKGGRIDITGENIMASGQTEDLEAGPYTLIRIADNGIGIKREHIGMIFDPYFTTKQSGTGLGLTSVLSIIKKHRGHIEVTSEENKGTSISIYLRAKVGAQC